MMHLPFQVSLAFSACEFFLRDFSKIKSKKEDYITKEKSPKEYDKTNRIIKYLIIDKYLSMELYLPSS